MSNINVEHTFFFLFSFGRPHKKALHCAKQIHLSGRFDSLFLFAKAYFFFVHLDAACGDVDVERRECCCRLPIYNMDELKDGTDEENA